MRSLFVMDPLEHIVVAGDSTYAVMRECSDRGHPTWCCTPEHLFARGGEVSAQATPVRTTAEAPWFHVEPTETLPLGAFDVVWMRKDPPYDIAYVFTTWLLDMAPPATLVVNDPVGLKLFNEKLWAMHFARFHPDTLLTRDAEQIRAFVHAQEGRVVVKPWHGNGGRGVLVTDKRDRNLGSIIELLTRDGREHIIVQPFLPGIDQGDKRILLFDGEPVGAMLRVPAEDDYRGNMHVGATVVPCELDARDREICEALAPELKRWGQLFVGIDIIQGHLTEINVTSPTGIREINKLYGLRLEGDLVDRVEARLAAHRERT